MTAAPTPATRPSSGDAPSPAVASRLSNRLLGTLVAGAGLSVLLVAARLNPDPRGYGTHTQLGLPPCPWVIAPGRPCPTCGMTTAFAHAAHGHFLDAFRAHPLGLVLALTAAAGFWVGLHAAFTGSRVLSVCGKLLTPKVLWTAAALWGASWAYKVFFWTV